MAEEAVSTEDRIANLMFGEEEVQEDAQEEERLPLEAEQEQGDEQEGEQEQEASAEDTADETEFVAMEINGQLYEIPKALEGHLLRDKDYTQKTQEVSAQRKEAEAVRAALQQEQAKYQFMESVQNELNEAETIKAQLAQVQKYRREQIDSLDYKDLIKLDAHRDELKEQLTALQQSLQTKQTEFQQAQQQSLQELLAKSTEALRSKIPNWGEASQKQVREFALKSGFTDQELNSVYDPRQVEVLWKASQYDALQSGKGAAIKTVQAAPSIKAKARKPMPKEVGDKLNLRKKLKGNASDYDKAQAIGSHIANRFM